MSPPADDADLVARARDGERSARAELFRRHARRLTALLVRLLGSHADAEDAVQEAFVTAFRDLHQLRDANAIGSWLTQLAVRQSYRCHRRRRLLAALGLDQAPSEATLERLADARTPPDVRAELALLDDVLDRMPIKERTAWMLRFVEGHDLQEVALLCGCSLATAKRRIAAGQARVAAHVKVEEGGDG